MQKKFINDTGLIIGIFLISRILLYLCGVQLDFLALFRNWQYLEIETLRNNLLRGVWYDHTQPPVFNLFLGIVVKLSGSYSETVFIILFKLMTLINTFLLYAILKRTIHHPRIPIVLSLIYLLSPGTMLFENELFYTSFISMLLLTAAYFLCRLQDSITVKNVAGFFIPVVLACLTRSMYHIVWIILLSSVLLWFYWKQNGWRILVAFSFLSVLFVGGWYVKNYVLFHSFSTSSWMGMNVARNVFHDFEAKDSSRIESIEPFSNISAYKRFLPEGYERPYLGMNDRDLLPEFKNDSFSNQKNIGFLEISKQYMQASKAEVKAHPFAYIKNVVQSAIIFFAPATRYPLNEYQAAKIKYYDVVYSFNLSHFAEGKQQRRIALLASAIPKMIIYIVVFFALFRQLFRRKTIAPLYLFITITIGYIFLISSFFEHYENMRFRYEAEPLFLILAGYILNNYLIKRKSLTK
jgi:hypothetical protein